MSFYRGGRRRRTGTSEPGSSASPTSLVGECQICARDQRLREGELVLHGYLRPGWGSIQGRCPGVGHPPYEVSIDLLRDYVERALPERKAWLVGRLEEADDLREVVRSGYGRTVVTRREEPRWRSELERYKQDLDYQIRQVDAEVVAQGRRIAAWPGPRPLSSLASVPRSPSERDPAVAAARAERAAQRAARAAERAAKAIYAPDGSPLVVPGRGTIATKIAARNELAGRARYLYGTEERRGRSLAEGDVEHAERLRGLAEEARAQVEQISAALAAAGIDPVPIVERARKAARR